MIGCFKNMQLLQGILCFIDIKMWHNIENSIFPHEKELLSIL